jgi:hypothetical protein
MKAPLDKLSGNARQLQLRNHWILHQARVQQGSFLQDGKSIQLATERPTTKAPLDKLSGNARQLQLRNHCLLRQARIQQGSFLQDGKSIEAVMERPITKALKDKLSGNARRLQILNRSHLVQQCLASMHRGDAPGLHLGVTHGTPAAGTVHMEVHHARIQGKDAREMHMTAREGMLAQRAASLHE